MDNSKNMYDAWFDDILDDVRDNVLGEYWHKYLNYKYYREILKDSLHRSKLVHNHKYPSRSSVLHFNYGGGYELESPSNSVNHIEKYSVPENELNELHHVYYFIINHIVKTQGEEKNMLTESNDKQKEFLDKVVNNLLKESKYRFWDDKHYLNSTYNKEQHLKKIRVDIKFGLVNKWREDPIEYFDMKMVKDNLTKRRRKTEYLEDYERDQLTNIYGLSSDEIMGVIHKYYNSFYNNIYNSFLEMDEDDKIPTSKPEKWIRGDEVFDIGGSLNESVIGKNDDEVIGKEFWFEYHCWESPESCDAEAWYRSHQKVRVIGRGEDDHDQYPGEVKVYKIRFEDGLEYDVFEDELLDSPEEFYRPAPPLNESIDKQRRYLDRVIEQLVKGTIIYPHDQVVTISPSGDPDTKFSANRVLNSDLSNEDYFYNRFLSYTIKECRDVYGLTNEEINYVWNKYFDQIKTKYKQLKGLNESTEKPKGMDLKYLFKVADFIMKEIELDDYEISGAKMRGYGPWNNHSTGHYGFWTGLQKHAKDIYGLTQAETEMVSDLVWDSLNAKNIYLSTYIQADESTRKWWGSLREQRYEEWDERSRERNINLLKVKGIDILSTDTNVPFYRRIDSKEIRYLKKVVDRLDKESKLESVGDLSDGDYLLLTPFGKFEYFGFMNEYRHSRFEKYVDDIYGVGDKQIMFPTGKSIAKTRESAFLWEMYKDKLRRKQLKLVNPGLSDIPDDAIITEQDFSSDELKSLDSSFENMGTPPEIASEELGDMITWVKNLPKELFLYRVLYLDEINDINYDELGSHYSQDRTDLINNHYNRGSIYGHRQGEDAYLITVKVPKSEVDVMETLNNNILYPHEKEITLKDKGRGAQYLDIEKL